MQNAKRRLSVSLPMQKKSMDAMDNPKGSKKIVHAGDAYFCCHESKETGQLDMEKSKNGIRISVIEIKTPIRC